MSAHLPILNDRGSAVRSLAVVSGKGGSGKTLVAAALALALAEQRRRVLLIDADLGTGGLSYYLGFKTFVRTRTGVSDFVMRGRSKERIFPSKANIDLQQVDKRLEWISMLSVGDHRRLLKARKGMDAEMARALLREYRSEFDICVVDCRGGIDEDSIAVCRAVDEILIVAETDAASIQATQHLSDVFTDNELDDKVVGFVINKVMDDPSSLAKTAQALFRADYLASVPFDLDTTRDFIRGDLPRSSSLFYKHVASVIPRVLKNAVLTESSGLLRSDQFGRISMEGPNERYANAVLGLITFGLIASLVAVALLRPTAIDRDVLINAMSIFAAVATASLLDPVKGVIGKAAAVYAGLVRRLLQRA